MSNLKRTLIHGLEHGLKIYNDNGFGKDLWGELEIISKTSVGIRYGKKAFKSLNINECTPYLFDLSSLTKEIEIGGQRFVPKEWLRMNYIGESMGLNTASWSHRTIEKLCEWQFNCFNLSPDEFIEVTDELNPYK